MLLNSFGLLNSFSSDSPTVVIADSFTVSAEFTDVTFAFTKESEPANTWYNGEWFPSPWHKTPWYEATDNIVLNADAFTIETIFADITTSIDILVTVMDAEPFTVLTTFTDAKLYVPFEVDSFAVTSTFQDVTFEFEFTSDVFIISTQPGETFDGKGINFGTDICYNSSTDLGYTIVSRVDVDSILLDGIFGDAPQPFQIRRFVGETPSVKSVTTVEFNGTDWNVISTTTLGL